MKTSDPTNCAIAERLAQIRQTLPETVRLIAVSKQVSTAAIKVAYEAGVRDFGESRIQEAIPKQDELADLKDITWHFIGHLQSNKVAKVVERFQWIHSVDSLKLAQKLNQVATEHSTTPNLCLQVKIVPDPGKYGWTVPELLLDLPTLDQLRHLNIAGLMVIPPYGLTESETLSIFTQARELADKIRHEFCHGHGALNITHLSMGMSEDYPLAIQAGSTMIRLGRVLFGDRE